MLSEGEGTFRWVVRRRAPNGLVLIGHIAVAVEMPRLTGGDRFSRNDTDETVILLNRDALASHRLSMAEVMGHIRRLLGVSGVKGEWMGLPDDWSFNVIKLVGNYSEVFERNVGKDSPLQISRGLNALWKDGGIQYAPPLR